MYIKIDLKRYFTFRFHLNATTARNKANLLITTRKIKLGNFKL